MIAEVITSLWLGIVAPHLGEPQTVRCTCYLPTGNRTYDGTVPYEGIIASNKEHLGDMCLIFDMDGNFIALMESRDCGGNRKLRNGTAIDVYRDNMERAKEWIATYGDYVQIVWVKADG